jgi:hypothetical protein
MENEHLLVGIPLQLGCADFHHELGRINGIEQNATLRGRTLNFLENGLIGGSKGTRCERSMTAEGRTGYVHLKFRGQLGASLFQMPTKFLLLPRAEQHLTRDLPLEKTQAEY